jgi:hypothetical protein
MTVDLPGTTQHPISLQAAALASPAGLLDSRAEFPDAAHTGGVLASLEGTPPDWSVLTPRDAGGPTLTEGIVLAALVVLLALPLCRRVWLAMKPREIVDRNRSTAR